MRKGSNAGRDYIVKMFSSRQESCRPLISTPANAGWEYTVTAEKLTGSNPATGVTRLDSRRNLSPAKQMVTDRRRMLVGSTLTHGGFKTAPGLIPGKLSPILVAGKYQSCGECRRNYIDLNVPGSNPGRASVR